MAQNLHEILTCPIMPVVNIERVDHAAQITGALAAGGISCIEITLRTPAAFEAISAGAKTPGFVVGAGTVRTAEDVERSIAAGARFIVSPGFDERVIRAAKAQGVPAIPGVATATELQRALDAGVTYVKFFPAAAMGGVPTLRALSAPFPEARFMPSGGLSRDNFTEYLALSSVFAVGGTWMVPLSSVESRDWESIRELSRNAMEAAR